MPIYPVWNPADALDTYTQVGSGKHKGKTIYRCGYGDFVYSSADGKTGERLYKKDGEWKSLVENQNYAGVMDNLDMGLGGLDIEGGMAGFMREFLEGLRNGTDMSGTRFPDLPRENIVGSLDNAIGQIKNMAIPSNDKKTLISIMEHQVHTVKEQSAR